MVCSRQTIHAWPISIWAIKTAIVGIVNLDWGHELFPPKRSLRSEPADFQRGEVEIDGVNLYYDAWETNDGSGAVILGIRSITTSPLSTSTRGLPKNVRLFH